MVGFALRLLGGIAIVLGSITGAGAAEGSRKIALTFDDAPRGDGGFFSGEERTGRLIRELKEAGVDEAMFFVKTGHIRSDADRERLQAYVRAGHRLANHSHSHDWLRRTEAAEYLADVARASEILIDFEGYDPFFRFPYLDEGRSEEKRDAVRDGLAELELQHGYVTVDNYDWHLAGRARRATGDGSTVDREALKAVYIEHILDSVAFYDRIARDTLGRSPKHVLLLHENDLAALFIGDLVAALRERGWEIIGARDAYDDPIAERLPETVFNGQGRVAALAHAGGATARDLVQVSEDEVYLDLLLEERGAFTNGD